MESPDVELPQIAPGVQDDVVDLVNFFQDSVHHNIMESRPPSIEPSPTNMTMTGGRTRMLKTVREMRLFFVKWNVQPDHAMSTRGKSGIFKLNSKYVLQVSTLPAIPTRALQSTDWKLAMDMT